MRKAVPLRAVLGMQDDQIITDHIGMRRIIHAQRIVHVRLSIAQRRPQHRWMATGIEHIPTRYVERQTEVE